MQIFKNDWEALLEPEMQKPYYRELRQFLIGEYRTHRIYPDMYSIFNALHYTAYADVKVVILGQDPYHGPGRPTGCPSLCCRECPRHRRSSISSRSCRTIWAAPCPTMAA